MSVFLSLLLLCFAYFAERVSQCLTHSQFINCVGRLTMKSVINRLILGRVEMSSEDKKFSV